MCTGPGAPLNNHQVTNWVNYTKGITQLRLKEINFATGKVEFKKNTTRTDAPRSKLDTIRISDKNINGTFTLRKKIFFNNSSYFVSPTGTTTDKNRLKLTGITISTPQDASTQNFSFYYNSTVLPERTSVAQDWWGFYNGKTSNTTLIKSETITFNGYQYIVGSANRDPDATAMQACILNTIKYPTGGYTRFEYEPNYYGTTTPIMAGGLRIKAIRDYEGPGKVPMTKIYKYGANNLGMGNLLITPEGLSNSKQEINFEYGVLSGSGSNQFCNMNCSGTRMIITGRPSFDLTTFNGSPVVYPEVTVYDSSSTTMPNGKRIYKFNFVEDQTVSAPKAYNNGKFQSNDSWKGGDENYISVFANSGVKIEDTYSTTSVYLASIYTYGTKVGWKITREGCPYYYQPSVYYDFYYFDYPIYSGFKKLTNTKWRQYSLTDPVNYFQTEIKNYYENLSHLHQQLTKKSLYTSTGDSLETRYWYAADYDSTVAALTQIKYMQKHNIIALPIKEQTYRENSLTLGKVTDYNTYGNPSAIYIKETDVPVPPINHQPGQIVPVGYVKRASLTYDSNQNLIMVQKNDSIKTTYLWGYYNSLPVAQIENATYQEVQTAFGGTIPNLAGGGFSTSQNTTLRNGLPKALVSTFTYIPFYGMTSKVDPSAITTSFEYDGMARLKLIKDNDGRILKTYQYNYRP